MDTAKLSEIRTLVLTLREEGRTLVLDDEEFTSEMYLISNPDLAPRTAREHLQGLEKAGKLSVRWVKNRKIYKPM